VSHVAIKLKMVVNESNNGRCASGKNTAKNWYKPKDNINPKKKMNKWFFRGFDTISDCVELLPLFQYTQPIMPATT
jgi:hypothetical protein